MAAGDGSFDPLAAAAFAARTFLETGAVHFYDEKPFIFTSGWASPVYLDCRALISFPAERRRLMGYAVDLVKSEVGAANFDAVAGYETAGVPFAAWMAERLDVPMSYVRKQPKGFARNALIEGRIAPGQRVLMIDDLATDGRSKVRFCRALREAGAVVEHGFVLFYYGIFPHAAERLAAEGLTLHALASWSDVLAAAKALPSVDRALLGEVEEFLADPIAWSRAHGGVGEDRPIAQPYNRHPVNG